MPQHEAPDRRDDPQPEEKCPTCGSLMRPCDGGRSPQDRIEHRGYLASQRYSIVGFSVFFLASTMFILAASIALTAYWIRGSRGALETAEVLAVLAGFFVLPATALLLIALYHAWEVVQPLRRQDVNIPTPGMAVSLLFIPLFNIYWMFVATVGLANHLNCLTRLGRHKVKPMKTWLPIAMCLLGLLAVIPYLHVLGAVSMIMWFIFIQDATRVTNTLIATSHCGALPVTNEVLSQMSV